MNKLRQVVAGLAGVCNIISGEEADMHLLGLVPGQYNALAGAMSPFPMGGMSTSPVGAVFGVDGYYDALGAQALRPMHPMLAHPAMHRPAPVFHHPAMAHPMAHPIARIAPSHPGTPQPGMRWLGLPLLNSAFTSTSGTALPFGVTPQHYFKGRRWVYVETRTGATATGLVTLANPSVGTHIQLVAAGSTSVAQYAPNAYDTDESLDPCGPGVTIAGTLNISAAPTMTDRIDFNFSIKGETLA